MSFVETAAEQLNIHFSAPRETQYQFKTLGRFASPLCALNGSLTLRDLACMHPDLYEGRKPRSQPNCTHRKIRTPLEHREHFAEVRSLSHKGLTRYVKESILNQINTVDLENDVECEIVPNQLPRSNADQAWDNWVIAGMTEENEEDFDDAVKDIKNSVEELESFVRDELAQLDALQGVPCLHTKHEPFCLAAYATFASFYGRANVTVSACDLAQQIIEDFALGVAVKPFFVKRQEHVPVLCHLVIGKHNGTTIASFPSLQWREDDIAGLAETAISKSSTGTNGEDTDSEDSLWFPTESDEEDGNNGDEQMRSYSFCTRYGYWWSEA
ncbi:expressed unknown protein [Seminavis robusta]|uniref:Uncharacterized protein n=1 Tax=Seminavis robusta TaxID=568900 RepID=A0A9N8EVF0_9STRA|nr:expressed unknown protein [Seminavis robusta]|eukprot:Sro1992_g309860.1 n/a (327) ;mRNA; f:12732-13712